MERRCGHTGVPTLRSAWCEGRSADLKVSAIRGSEKGRWSLKLEGRVSIITGSASGIGRASALEFGKEGAPVVVADLNLEGAQETAIKIESAGGVALAVKTDAANPESVQALVEQTVRTFGRINVLFNNAATQVNKTVEETTM